MSRKTKRQKPMQQNESMEMSDLGIRDTAKETLDTFVGTVNSHKLLIGGIAGACGAAIFLLATERGKRLRSEIQDRSIDFYEVVSDQVVNGWDKVRDLVESAMSEGRAQLEE